jgi:hypothetical protein
MLDFQRAALICLAAYFHDIGKTGYQQKKFEKRFPEALARKGKGFPSPPHSLLSDWLLQESWEDYRNDKLLRALVALHHWDAVQSLPGYPPGRDIREKDAGKLLFLIREADGLARSVSASEAFAEKEGRLAVEADVDLSLKSALFSPFWVFRLGLLGTASRLSEVFTFLPRGPVRRSSSEGFSNCEEFLTKLEAFRLADLTEAGSFSTAEWTRLRQAVRGLLSGFYEAYGFVKPGQLRRDGLSGEGNPCSRGSADGLCYEFGSGQDVSLWTHSSLTAALAVCLYLSKSAGVSLACLAFPRSPSVFDVPAEGGLRQVQGRMLLLEELCGRFREAVAARVYVPPDAEFLSWNAGMFMLVPRGWENAVWEAFEETFRDFRNTPDWIQPRLTVVPVRRDALPGSRPGRTIEQLRLDLAVVQAWREAWGFEGGRSLAAFPDSPMLREASRCRFCGVPAGQGLCAACEAALKAASRRTADRASVSDPGGEIAGSYAAGAVGLRSVRELLGGALEGTAEKHLTPGRLISLLQKAQDVLFSWKEGGSGGRRIVLMPRPDEALVLLPADELLDGYAACGEAVRRETWLNPEDAGLEARFLLADECYPVRDAFGAALEVPSGALLSVNGTVLPADAVSLAKALRDSEGPRTCLELAHIVATLPSSPWRAARVLSQLRKRRESSEARAVARFLEALEKGTRSGSWTGGWPKKVFVTALLAAAGDAGRLERD